MKKKRVTDLKLCTTLKGLYTLGVDENNESVCVSLEFLETTTSTAVANAQQATKDAYKARDDANSAASKATQEANKATDATNRATQATNESISVTEKANVAIAAANDATAKSTAQTDKAKQATDNAIAATNANNAATEEAVADAKQATKDAREATTDVTAAVTRLIPTGLEVKAPSKLTIGNKIDNFIDAELQPENTMKNVIFISDNRAVDVDPDGRIIVVAKGTSRVHVVPTCNAALAKTVCIQVEDPTMRLLNTRSALRFTSAGTIRLT